MTACLCALLLICPAQSSGPCLHKLVRVGAPEPGAEPVRFVEVSHESWRRLLGHYVDEDGQVCYAAWQADRRAVCALRDYLHSLGRVDATDVTADNRDARLAFYINAYNALVVWGILLEYPTPSIQAHNRAGARYRIFDHLQVWLGDGYHSLNDIEHGILRPMDEHRIHFALVCAARGCPRLRREAYNPLWLDWQLHDNAVHFFSASDRFRIARWLGTVRLSPILKWFAEDFGATQRERLVTILPYLRPDDRQWLGEHLCEVSVRHLGYDWGLNDQCPTPYVTLARLPYAGFSKFEPAVRPLLGLGDDDEPAADTSDHRSDEPPTAEAARPDEPAAPPLGTPDLPERVEPSVAPADPEPPKVLHPEAVGPQPEDFPPPPRILRPQLPEPATDPNVLQTALELPE